MANLLPQHYVKSSFFVDVHKASDTRHPLPTRCSQRTRTGINPYLTDYIVTSEARKRHYSKQKKPAGGGSIEMTCDSVERAVIQPGTAKAVDDRGGGSITVEMICVAVEVERNNTIIYPKLKCNAQCCEEEIFIACPLCLNVLCYDH